MGLHLDGPARAVVLAALDERSDWCSSGMTLMESLALVDRVTDEPVLRSDLEDLVRLSWDRVAVVPVDQRCLDRAGALMREQPLRLADAIHLAAADRLPATGAIRDVRPCADPGGDVDGLRRHLDLTSHGDCRRLASTGAL